MNDCIGSDDCIELPNPGEEGYRTAHKQNKDGSYADIVMLADVFVKNVSKVG